MTSRPRREKSVRLVRHCGADRQRAPFPRPVCPPPARYGSFPVPLHLDRRDGPSTPNRFTVFTSSRFAPACGVQVKTSPAGFHSPPSMRAT